MYSGTIRLKIPICPACQKKWQRRQRNLVIGGLTLIGLFGLSAFLLAGHLTKSFLFGLTVAGGLVSVSVFVLLRLYHLCALPVRPGLWWAFGNLRMRFRNPAFVHLLANCSELQNP